ncbi:hypothetical protein D1871_16675 [Nakamurella silvestris]|nr:hypothetical protein D1871_16675 [Nakamurella silvestris]
MSKPHQVPVDPPPISIPPPPAVKIAGLILAAETFGILILAVVIVFSRHEADVKWVVATASYFLLIAAFIGASANGLLRGRRWARSPGLTIQILILAVGFYLAFPSGQLMQGIGLMVLGLVTGAMLIGRQATEWITSFPPLFGPEPDR